MRKLLVLFAATVSGCAFTDVPLELPTTGIESGLSGGKGRQIVVASSFADQRSIRDRCGMQKNGYNMDTADAVCSSDPAAWLAQVLAAELRNAGFSVQTDPSAAKPSALHLDGTLLKIFVEPVIGTWTGTMETDLQVSLIATSQTGLQAEREFFSKAMVTVMVSKASNYALSLDDATQKLVKDMVFAVLELMDRYPQLGRRPNVLLRVSHHPRGAPQA